MKRISAFLLLLILCNSCSSVISSRKDIGDFRGKVSFSKEYGSDVARITGKQMDSALWVKNYMVIYEKDKIMLTINRSLKQTGMSGLYLIEFLVPSMVTEIYLDSGEMIWERPEQKN